MFPGACLLHRGRSCKTAYPFKDKPHDDDDNVVCGRGGLVMFRTSGFVDNDVVFLT